jgi:hypothetical protein
MGRQRRKSLIEAEMTILPLQFHHVGVMRGLRSGKETIMNASIQLRLHNHFSGKNKQIDTQEISKQKYNDTWRNSSKRTV